MTQPITDAQLNHLLNFVGYGSLSADVWFLGMEEGGGDEENIRARLKFRTVEDCKEAHRRLKICKFHWGNRVIQRTWRGMCHVMLRLDGKKPTIDNIRNYQAEKLGQSDGRTLLTELMPIPKPKVNVWEYCGVIPRFKDGKDYYTKIKPRRIEYLRQLIAEHKPKLVIGYGKGFWPEYKKLFENLKFLQINQFEIAKGKTSFVILTHHFTARTMNGKFDEMVEIIETQSTMKNKDVQKKDQNTGGLPCRHFPKRN